MKILLNRIVILTLLVLAALFNITSAWSAEATSVQVLDRVLTFDADSVLDMKFDDPPPAMSPDPDFTVLINAPGSNFQACKLTATKGTFCLTDEKVINWPTGTAAGGSDEIVFCNDDVFGAKSCTGMTVDPAGNIWLAVRSKGKTHNLFKIEARVKDALCPTPSLPTDNPEYCATVWAEDKPLLLDLNSIDGDAAAAFTGFGEIGVIGKAVLGLQERKTAVVFQDNGMNKVIEGLSGKRAWGLAGNEHLQSIALLQLILAGSEELQNYILVTTSKGRVIASNTNDPSDTKPVYTFLKTDSSCNFGDDEHYGIRTSSKSGLIYVTDSQCRLAIALEPAVRIVGLNEVLTALDPVADLTLSTIDSSTDNQVLGPTTAPGESIDLEDCGKNGTVCTLVSGTTSEMSNVTLVDGSETGMTLFLIERIPDCRLGGTATDACMELVGVGNPMELFPDVIFDRADNNTIGSPGSQLLNVTPLLPADVVEAFGGALPPMWISHQYRAQKDPDVAHEDGFFTALFGFTEAEFTGVFDLELNVGQLAGGQRGCIDDAVNNTPVEDLIAGYDVAVKVSERFISINREHINGSGPNHEVMLTNTGCGTSRMSGSRWSLWAIDLGFSPDTFDETTRTLVPADDAVFGDLLTSLYDDLDQSVNDLACHSADGQMVMPLDTTACGDFNSALTNTRDKFDKCLDATLQPKKSLINQNCQAYSVQFQTLQNVVTGFTLTGDDPANRIGEAQVRLLVIENIFDNLFFPSIPEDGFLQP